MSTPAQPKRDSHSKFGPNPPTMNEWKSITQTMAMVRRRSSPGRRFMNTVPIKLRSVSIVTGDAACITQSRQAYQPMPPPPNGSGGTGDEGFHDPPSTWDRFGGHFAGDFTGRWRSLHLCQQGIEFTRCRGEHHENSGEAGQAAHQTEDRAYCSCSPREEFEFKRLHDCSNISEMVVENSSVKATPCYCRLHRARRSCSCMLQISRDHQ